MKYDFDTIIDRRNTNSLKWNVGQEELAMWVADMDFKTAPCVQEAIQKKVNLGIYGYSDIPEAYFTSFKNWWWKRYNYWMDTKWMMFSSGVVPAISSIVRRLTLPNETILVQSPVYNIFYNSITNNGRNVISSDLQYEQGCYTIDFEDLERKLKNPQTTMMLLCNPHNPIGKVWRKEELKRIGALCDKYQVRIVSDEIHADITKTSKSYIPFASVNEQCKKQSITCLSASKAFNLAGLQAACVVVPDDALRHRIYRGLNNDEVAEPNVFACETTIAAFQHGESWLEELREYINENKNIAQQYIHENIPQLHLVSSDATYLLWIDCQQLHPFVSRVCDFLHQEKQLLIVNGSSYGENGTDFIRMNIACPREQMLLGLRRLKEGVDQFTNQFLQTC